ncbi:adenylate/guanylate cyclase domain-containing protein [Streptomyces rochei]|uniref:adenylate/guanylate cyclase domain-containing protein n=1 Tax=Streptomyces rochei TaxID=1928 RepID=UPI0022E9EFF5|nr:adenylate/guanylate cyclase domain-containing protein [Streptomyces rochei]MCC8452880.1 adenylate/guanylate cyclase domain-containing protein [Streptomyces rochei]
MVGLAEDVEKAVTNVVCSNWNTRKGLGVPETEDVSLSNGAVEVDAVYLYADLANSTSLAQDFTPTTAAKVIRAYLDATCRIIRARGGKIRSFDGDRVMAVFMGPTKNTDAARCALQINHAVKKIVRPKAEANLSSLKTQGFEIKHCVGIDSGKALIVRGGVRGSNDLVSIGRAPNVAAKLSDVRNGNYHTYITKDVYEGMLESMRTYNGRPVWEGPFTREIGDKKITVYRSSWTWSL